MRPGPTISPPFADAADLEPPLELEPRVYAGRIFASPAYVQRIVTAAAAERRRRLGARAP